MDLSRSGGHTVSLSMRMRSEASLPPPQKFPTIQGSSSASNMLGSSKKSTKMMGSTKLKPNAALSMSKEELLRECARQELVMESTAGNIDAVASGGVFADRTIMTQPSASCVRCGDHASVCMSCTEFLAEEALNFYRKTRARGAASLFANAITQTGVTKVVKYIMFVTWRNGFRERKWRGRKLAFKADIMFRDHFIKMAFYGWVKFNMSTVKENRDKKIEELEKRVATLESITQQATNLKESAERQAKNLQSQFDKFTGTISEQEARIAHLETEMVLDRSRVVGLSALCQPLVKLESLHSQGTEGMLTEVQGGLHRLARTQQPHFNYGKTYSQEDTEGALEAETRRLEKAKPIDLEELDPSSYEMVELLLQWASAKSREANNIMEPGTGKALKCLPKYRAVESFDDLKSGAALLRVVLALVWDLPRATREAGKYERVDGAGAGGGEEKEEEGAGGDGKIVPYEAILKQVENGTKSALGTIECALELGKLYLALPRFLAADVTGARSEVCAALLGHLMLVSSCPAQPLPALNRTGKLIEAFETCKQELTAARFGISGFAQARKIAHCLGVLLGTVEAAEAAPAPPGGVAGGAAGGAGGAADGAADDDGGGEEKKEGVNEDGTDTPAPASVTAPHEQHYSALTAAVDGYLSSLGEWDDASYTWSGIKDTPAGSKDTPAGSKDTPAGGSNNPFVGELEAYEDSIRGLSQLREECAEHRSSGEAAGRLAGQVRQGVAGFLNSVYLQELKWLQ